MDTTTTTQSTMQPFERVWADPASVERTRTALRSKPLEYWVGVFGRTPTDKERDDMIEDALDKHEKNEIYKNDLYQVVKARVPGALQWPDMIHLSIKRIDKQPAHDWRHFQQIKNELVGPLNEAVELYPAESRLVDTANQYHLWVIAEPGMFFPLGFPTRLVGDESLGDAVQRPQGKA